jgi:dipeptidyl-peptidase-4
MRFWRVDPATGRRTPLLEERSRAQLAAEWTRVTGAATAAALPFAEFSFEKGGRALRFASQGRTYLFDLTPPPGSLREIRLPERTGPAGFLGTATAFSPDFDRYAFFRDYDHLVVADTRTGEERKLAAGTGEDHSIGLLGTGPSLVWSPDGRWIAYFTANTSNLYEYPILRSLERHATVERLRYPFVSDPNPALALHLIEVESGRRVTIAEGTDEFPYLREIEWLPDSKEVTFQAVHRFENRRELRAADPVSGRVRTILVDSDEAYLDPIHNFRVLADGKRFLWSSERSGWRHLYLYDLSGRELAQLTSGEWETAEVIGVDEAQGWVYVVGHTALGLERHLFRVRLDGTAFARLTPEPGTHQVSLDPQARFFTDDASSLAAPRSVRLRRADGALVRELASTDTRRVAEQGLQPPELLTVKAADGVTELHGLLFKPADFDPASRYPVIVPVYGGPHSKAIRNRYEATDYRAGLAQLGFLVAEFDARGTPYRGKRFQAGNYLKLGQVDVDDQAAAVRQLARRPYVDSARVGVTGISHGGYLTLMLMLRYPEVFSVGVAGAPITDVRNGPRQYIGRFMRTPEANPEGFARADANALAGNLRGRLLIHHGTNDRNAVLGNTYQFVRRLVDLGKPVDLMIYPDGVHVLEGRDAAHVARLAASYFLEHLKPRDWERSRAALW